MRVFYISLIVLSILAGIYFFVQGTAWIPEKVLMWVAFLPFFAFSYGVLGLLILRQARQEHSFFWWLAFPFLIALLFYIFQFVHIFFLEPYLCPCLRQ
jgi:uncharacterized membrane protein HdeD (DUF308 family)